MLTKFNCWYDLTQGSKGKKKKGILLSLRKREAWQKKTEQTKRNGLLKEIKI
jgi:hypothetical protein